MQKRNKTVAVIGAGDFIGGEIAKKFASEGFTIFAGRRNGAKLEPLVKEIEAAGGEIHARSLDARKEEVPVRAKREAGIVVVHRARSGGGTNDVEREVAHALLHDRRVALALLCDSRRSRGLCGDEIEQTRPHLRAHRLLA